MAEDANATVPGQGGQERRIGSSATIAAGAIIGKYEILSVLGQGSFGITYRARDTRLDRDVAIKEYLPTAFAVRDPDSMVLPRSTQLAEHFRWGRDRFLNEAKTLARLEHAPGIVNVYDFLEANGTAYMVMALMPGQTLEARLRREGVLSQAAVERILHPLLEGLERVHAAGFLHRDIKPANILIDKAGTPTLIDFGASRAALQGRTQTLTAVYTPAYAAFEQFTAARQGPWTDIYALGATLYHCVAGTQPPSAIERQQEDTLVPASEAGKGRFAPRLLAAIDAALRLKAAERPQSIAEWRHTIGLHATAAPRDEPAPSWVDAPGPQLPAQWHPAQDVAPVPTRTPDASGKPRGLGGWLVAALLWLLFILAVHAALFSWNLLQVFEGGLGDAYLTVRAAAVHAVFLVLTLCVLWTFARRSRRGPLLYIVWLCALLGIELAARFDVWRDLRYLMADFAEFTSVKDERLIFFVICTIVGTLYFSLSRRVKNTFTRYHA